ncbi:MAG: hypothetical protein QM723_14945 [Myxococcaceae bacterium]
MDFECCSTNCQGGFCAPAFTCQAYGDICNGNSDCCSGRCSVTDGGPGACENLSGGGGGGCIQDGNPCSGGSNCCSRICLDPGAGATVCLPATGCRLTGDSCADTLQCCGNGTNGNVQCDQGTGRCDNGQACNGTGNICGAPVLPDGGKINASQDCCDGMKDVCKLDSSGIPRCFGGGSAQCPTGYTGEAPCCIAAGQTCQFKDQCCGQTPCLPNPDGGADFVCSVKPVCAALGDTCGAQADGGTVDCCAGTVCGSTELGTACQLPTDGGSNNGGDGGTGSDGGSGGDGGTLCKGNYTSCATSADCCSGICASADGGLYCLPPGACSPLNAGCTATADCCSGLMCVMGPSGGGTCQMASCPGVGQTCSTSNPCCMGLSCLDNGGNACGATGVCDCVPVIN